jgi:hypothetical protein
MTEPDTTEHHTAVSSTLATYAWNITHSLPGPDIPQTLHWRPTHVFTGQISGALLIATKLAVAGFLIFPISRAVRVYVHATRPKPVLKALLSEAGEFANRLRMAQTALDEYHREAFPTISPVDDPATLKQLEPVLPSTSWRFTTARQTEAREAIEAVIGSLGQITTLFGSGELTSSADAAASALQGRYDQLYDARHPPIVRGRRLPLSSQKPVDVIRWREEAEDRIGAYLTAAAACVTTTTETLQHEISASNVIPGS